MSTFRKINNWLHLWLGLISGIIVFIVCITGCIWVFNYEIKALIHADEKIARQNRPVINPGALKASVQKVDPDAEVIAAFYRQNRLVHAYTAKGDEEGPTVMLDPYSGRVKMVREGHTADDAFFEWILRGHRFLWLPVEIGRPIVNYATLVFVILLVTGLVWWWPKKWTRSTRDKSFNIKWNGTFKRVNLDLHNVLGFYSLIFLFFIAITGMVYGLQWFSKGLYWVTTGGESLPTRGSVVSDTTQAGKFYTAAQAHEKAWDFVLAKNPESAGFYVSYPARKDKKAAIYITSYASSTQFYDTRTYSFDQHTLKRFSKGTVYEKSFAENSFGGKFRKMNFDLHIGSILGLPGKVLAFLCSLIGASLPITGFLVWWGKRHKKPRKKPTARLQAEEQPKLKAQEDKPSRVFKPSVPNYTANVHFNGHGKRG